MGNGLAGWVQCTARILLALVLMMLATLCQARPLSLAYQCNSAPLVSSIALAPNGWRAATGASVQMLPEFDACWIRLNQLPRVGEHLTIKHGWATIALFDAQGRELARASRTGELSNALLSPGHVIMQPRADWSPPLYLRISTRMNKLSLPTGVLVEAQDIGPVLQADRVQTNISLAVSIAVLMVAFSSVVFSMVLRDRAYAWMAGFLLMSVVIRVFNSAEPLIFTLTQGFEHARLVSRLMYPVANAVWLLAFARMADFHIHAPRIDLLCRIGALLYLLHIPLWLMDGLLGTQVLVCLTLLMTYPLLFGGGWIAWRKGSTAAGLLLLGNLMLAGFWGPAQLNFMFPTATLTRFIQNSSQVGSLSSLLGVASDLLLPLLFAIALGFRTRGLKHAATRLVSHDALTDLPNREHIRRIGTDMLAKHPSLAVLVLNIGRFRAINGALGPDIGDQLLLITGRRLANIEGGTVARLHADQFCMLWPDAGTLPQLRERIEKSFSRPLDVDGQMVDLNLAIGVACASALPAPIAQLLRRAETALDTCRVLHLEWMEYHADLEQDLRADLGLLSELTRAVEEGELRMHLQPKVRLKDGAVTSAEALVRWQHPTRGMVPPGEFIPFAEQTGRIQLITQWMLGEAMRLCVRLRDEGTPLQISVNISTADLAKTGFVEGLMALAQQVGTRPEDIRLEVTESGAMRDPAASLLIMHDLRNAGFSLSIDDFGTGYSSLSYLQKMPVAELKIDRSFVHNVVAGTDTAVLLESTIELGHRLGLSVVAEGAETVGEWNLLEALGCDHVQGYFAARPMPLDDFLKWRLEQTPFRANRCAMATQRFLLPH